MFEIVTVLPLSGVEIMGAENFNFFRVSFLLMTVFSFIFLFYGENSLKVIVR